MSSPAITYNFFWKGEPRFRGSLPAYFKHTDCVLEPCPEGVKIGGAVYASYKAAYDRLFPKSDGWSFEETETVYAFKRKGCEVPVPSTFTRIFDHPSMDGLRVIKRGGCLTVVAKSIHGRMEYEGTYGTPLQLFEELVIPKGWSVGGALAEDYSKGSISEDPDASFPATSVAVPPLAAKAVATKPKVVIKASKLTIGASTPTPSPSSVDDRDGRSPGAPANAKAVERLLTIIKERVSDDKVTSELLEIYLSLTSE